MIIDAYLFDATSIQTCICIRLTQSRRSWAALTSDDRQAVAAIARNASI